VSHGRDSTPPMLPGSDDTRGESLEVGNIPMLLSAKIGRVAGALDVREGDFFVKNGFANRIFPNVVVTETFRGTSMCPVNTTLVVIVDWCRSSSVLETPPKCSWHLPVSVRPPKRE
jgi:hypothetical protein